MDSPPVVESNITLLQLPQEVLSAQSVSQLLDSEEQDCAILQLPSELRNRIYEFVLLDGPVVEVRKSYKTPCLLNTCRQIRSEAGSLYYATAIFSVKAERGGSHSFVHRNPSGLCILWLATRAFQGSKEVRKVHLDLHQSAPNGWMDVSKPIFFQMVRDQIAALNLGDGIRLV